MNAYIVGILVTVVLSFVIRRKIKVKVYGDMWMLVGMSVL